MQLEYTDFVPPKLQEEQVISISPDMCNRDSSTAMEPTIIACQ